jgi:hypothetical protein
MVWALQYPCVQTDTEPTMNKITLTALITASALTVATGCVQEEPPDLPPVGTMTAELGTMQDAPPAAKNADPAVAGDYANFANAWVRVNVLRLYATGVVAVPAVAMALALTQEPRQQGNSWLWSLTIGEVTGDLELTAGLVSGYDVGLYVTNPSEGLDQYLWIEGHANTALSEGYWVGHSVDLPAGDDELVEISWTYLADDDRSLEFSNVSSASEDVGDVIAYAVNGTTATVVYDDASEPEKVATIIWDTVTGVGSIQVPLYNDGNAACWDASFVNVACP